MTRLQKQSTLLFGRQCRLGIAFLTLGFGMLCNSAIAQKTTIAIEQVTVIPMDRETVLPDHTVLIRDGRIVSVYPSQKTRVPADAKLIDGRGKWLIPGLVDSHVHVWSTDDFTLYVAHGVTAVLNMSGSPQHLAWKEAIETKKLFGPKLFTTSPQLKENGNPATDTEITVRSVSEVSKIVKGFREDGYDFVKIWSSFEPDLHRAVMEAAKRNQMRVTGHVSREVGLAQALESGQDSIAHIEEYFNKYFQGKVDPTKLTVAAKLTARSRATVITTLMTYEVMKHCNANDIELLLKRPERNLLSAARRLSWQPKWNRLYQEAPRRNYGDALNFQLRIAKSLQDQDVRILAGTDAGELPGIVPGVDLHRELELLVAAGFSEYQALCAATRNAGSYLGKGKFGTLVQGNEASLLLLEENPLDNIENTRKIAGVMLRGKWLPSQELNSRMEILSKKNRASDRFVDLLAREGVDKATAHLLDEKKRNPNVPVLSYSTLIHLMLVYAQQGDRKTAEELLNLGVSEFPDSYRFKYAKGVVQLMSGNEADGKKLLEDVLQLIPEHRSAIELLKRY